MLPTGLVPSGRVLCRLHLITGTLALWLSLSLSRPRSLLRPRSRGPSSRLPTHGPGYPGQRIPPQSTRTAINRAPQRKVRARSPSRPAGGKARRRRSTPSGVDTAGFATRIPRERGRQPGRQLGRRGGGVGIRGWGGRQPPAALQGRARTARGEAQGKGAPGKPPPRSAATRPGGPDATDTQSGAHARAPSQGRSKAEATGGKFFGTQTP